MSNGNLADLIRRYQLAAAGYALAIEMGNTKDSDKCFDEVESTLENSNSKGSRAWKPFRTCWSLTMMA